MKEVLLSYEDVFLALAQYAARKGDVHGKMRVNIAMRAKVVDLHLKERMIAVKGVEADVRFKEE